MDKKTNDFMTALRDKIAAKDAVQDAQLADIMTGKVTATVRKVQPSAEANTKDHAPAPKTPRKAAKKAPKAS
ncbi:MAG: hypothetical protein U0694_15125 [Anaerolineae bacterium]